MADLKQSLAESCENLKLCRIRAAYYVQDKEKQLQADDILNCYDFFEWLIEQLFDVINSVFFRVTQIDEKLQISVHNNLGTGAMKNRRKSCVFLLLFFIFRAIQHGK